MLKLNFQKKNHSFQNTIDVEIDRRITAEVKNHISLNSLVPLQDFSLENNSSDRNIIVNSDVNNTDSNKPAEAINTIVANSAVTTANDSSSTNPKILQQPTAPSGDSGNPIDNTISHSSVKHERVAFFKHSPVLFIAKVI